ncbi:uncharacterized protein [Procambarus clarkii]|uniref:uncharacterized protein isoform X1 n=1 Tax=Procambarus clarkii TaxID=6728 RepID=UPI001E674410|nr:uncharacterized protein LOC123759709 isoform X1 [Procambarus clarkii]XP_045600907.1 uncharacterized protein LOC123759709 isoform X1 [Procambarus clarkii]
MPRYAYQKPASRVYSYSYIPSYDTELTHSLDSKLKAIEEETARVSPAPEESPKTFPTDESIYTKRASSVPPLSRIPDYVSYDILPLTAAEYPLITARAPLTYQKTIYFPRRHHYVDEVKQPGYQPIWMKHPYRLPVEDIKVPPHESSIWPEGVPHFNLVSSYDLMIDYLGLRRPCLLC